MAPTVPDYKQNLIEEGIEMLKHRQIRKQTEQDVEVMENRVRFLQRQEKTTRKKILLQQQLNENLEQIRKRVDEKRRQNEAQKMQTEIEHEQRHQEVQQKK